MTFVDPRVRMRDALCRLVRAEPTSWDQPSMRIFRNRLLDETGSDARPLAELLTETWQRGLSERLPAHALDQARWDVLAVPFVLQWSAERFVQTEMAQWAVESWALALGIIAPEQLRIAPPPRLPAPTVLPSRATASAQRTAAPSASSHSRSAARSPVARTAVFTVARAPSRPATTSRGMSSIVGSSGLNPRLVRGLAIAAVVSYLGFIMRIGWAVRSDRQASNAAPTARATPLQVAAEDRVAIPDAALALSSRGSASDTIASAISSARADTVAGTDAGIVPVPSSSAAASPATEPPPVAGGPGVPSVTQSVLSARLVDPSRILYVEPARRAQGNSRSLAGTQVAQAYDELFLNDGSSMKGRVDVVQAGSLIFQDRRTGLRHEIRKDDIDRIITEFGAPVRFRVADTASTPVRQSAVAARLRASRGPRGRGVGGSYEIRYGAADVVGSRECTELWRKPLNSVDFATVRHDAGADTLGVAFVGGDTFPSNIDADGYFASTFRIVPDQARTSTALTTRLTGQFMIDGSLALQVIIVFYRKVRDGTDVTCTVNVSAAGRKRVS